MKTKENLKRKNCISWKDLFMGFALLSSARSKDPNTQVGACACNEENRVLSVGYNGFPNGCSDDFLPWGKNGAVLDTKYPYVCHAELNTILSCQTNLRGADIYVTLFPCNECAKAIIQAGIQKVIYLSDKYAEQDSHKAARRLFTLAGIRTERYKPSCKKLTIDFVNGTTIMEK